MGWWNDYAVRYAEDAAARSRPGNGTRMPATSCLIVSTLVLVSSYPDGRSGGAGVYLNLQDTDHGAQSVSRQQENLGSR